MSLSRRNLLKWGAAGALAGVTGVGVGRYGANQLQVTRTTIALPKWDASGFRIGVIGDVHVGGIWGLTRAQHAVQMLFAEKPDVIVFVGDFASAAYGFANALKHIKTLLEPMGDASCPCYAILGNHDYMVPRPRLVAEQIKKSPVKLLRNEVVNVHGVSLVGLDDALYNHHDVSVIDPHNQSKSTVVLLHEPDFVDVMPPSVSLQISGHTHGGQVCLPGGVKMYTPAGGKKYVYGYYDQTAAPLFVTRGVGTTGMDIRLFCPPEVNVLTLNNGG